MEGICSLLGEDLEPCRDLEVRLGAEGVAALLDKAGKERFGLKAAHFQKQLSIKEEDQVLYEGLADSKYRPCPLLVKYVEAGWLGRKAQRGFYDYRGDQPVPTR